MSSKDRSDLIPSILLIILSLAIMGTALPDFGPNLISFVTTQFVIIVVFFILAFLVAFLQINQLIKRQAAHLVC